ncbi:MAG: phosphatase PAP2 family protein [Proteobacteria bacterium]|nr:phosphatase PAP2 family protein [Pseudomonadota bacterium]MCP4919972.1 phosphatase PAP2 family protein [Pseudomonadota bacterium]
MFLALIATANADETFTWEPAVDVPITLASGTSFALAYYVAADEMSPSGAKAQPTGIDGMIPAHYDDGSAVASDALLYGSIGVGLGVAVADGLLDDEGGKGARTRAWILTETFAVNQLATTTLKLAVDRPRPYTALDVDEHPEIEELVAEKDSEMSFPSGHASTVASMGFGAARMWQLSDAPRGQVVAAYSIASAATIAVSTLRVTAGVHHPTDVLGGAILGGCVGIAVPTLHVADRDIALGVGPKSVSVATRW